MKPTHPWLTETGPRPLRKYGAELRDLAINIVNRLDEMREDEDAGVDMIGVVENMIWNALFGYGAAIPVDKRSARLQEALRLADRALRSRLERDLAKYYFYRGAYLLGGEETKSYRGK
jgi:hypothetical protein